MFLEIACAPGDTPKPIIRIQKSARQQESGLFNDRLVHRTAAAGVFDILQE
jgi:hypothetical protein